MLQITLEQWEKIQLETEVVFIDKVKSHFQSEYPLLIAEIPEESLTEKISEGFKLTKISHLKEESYVVDFIGYFIEFGDNFLDLDELKAHKDWLQSEYVPAKFKIDRLKFCLKSKYFF